MSYQALYRVWRPRTFADVVGQTHITQTLQNAISESKFSHAYLFSGPRGTGKTSAAKIFAQTINCEQAPTREPCNECSACLGILDGSISDVIEIDAASNTSVDDIRDIRDKVKYAPSSVPYKVYIIDEVHMISVNAFNALLKTLEEPPDHVVFILATTEPHKIPLTIISRCQRFDFKPIGNKVIVKRMEEIIQTEAIEVDHNALEAIALAAEGGMRDALSLLDQAISYSDERVILEDVLAVTGGVSQSVLTEMVELLHKQEVTEVLYLFDHMIENGKDPTRFVFDIIYYLRDMLFYKTAAELEDVLDTAIVDENFKQVTNKIENNWIQEAIIMFNDCQQQIKWTNSPKIFIEITLLSIANKKVNEDNQSIQTLELPHQVDLADNIELKELHKKMMNLEKKLKEINVTNNDQPQATQKPKRQSHVSKQNKFHVPHEQIYSVLKEAKKEPLQMAMNNWEAFLTRLKSAHAPAHATIIDSKPAAASDDVIIVAFKYEIHCSLFLDHKDMVESILEDILGKSYKIIPLPEEAWQQVRTDYLNSYEPDEQEIEKNAQAELASPLIEEAKKLVGEELLEIKD